MASIGQPFPIRMDADVMIYPISDHQDNQNGSRHARLDLRFQVAGFAQDVIREFEGTPEYVGDAINELMGEKPKHLARFTDLSEADKTVIEAEGNLIENISSQKKHQLIAGAVGGLVLGASLVGSTWYGIESSDVRRAVTAGAGTTVVGGIILAISNLNNSLRSLRSDYGSNLDSIEFMASRRTILGLLHRSAQPREPKVD